MRRLPLGAILMAFSLAALAAPRAEPWQRWAAHTSSKVALDHGQFTAFLGAYVKPGSDGINRVAYRAVTPADRRKLDDYLAKLQAVAIRKYSRAEQRAYWINLYNAATLKVVLDHYPVESITKINISPGFFAKGPWGKKLLTVEGEPVSLDDIEHRILRPFWKDPRTHYAVNCASIGCPNLAPTAYTAGRMEQMLDEGARAYVNHARGLSIDGKRATVSSIYVWFQADFGGSASGVLEHLAKHAEPDLARRLAGIDGIAGHRYDWSLNDAR